MPGGARPVASDQYRYYYAGLGASRICSAEIGLRRRDETQSDSTPLTKEPMENLFLPITNQD